MRGALFVCLFACLFACLFFSEKNTCGCCHTEIFLIFFVFPSSFLPLHRRIIENLRSQLLDTQENHETVERLLQDVVKDRDEREQTRFKESEQLHKRMDELAEVNDEVSLHNYLQVCCCCCFFFCFSFFFLL